MTSFCKSYYQVFLAQGICVGLGAGCLFLPSVAIMASYFTSKRAFMTGIANAGGSIGTNHPRLHRLPSDDIQVVLYIRSYFENYSLPSGSCGQLELLVS